MLRILLLTFFTSSNPPIAQGWIFEFQQNFLELVDIIFIVFLKNDNDFILLQYRDNIFLKIKQLF